MSLRMYISKKVILRALIWYAREHRKLWVKNGWNEANLSSIWQPTYVRREECCWVVEKYISILKIHFSSQHKSIIKADKTLQFDDHCSSTIFQKYISPPKSFLNLNQLLPLWLVRRVNHNFFWQPTYDIQTCHSKIWSVF